jgi:CRP/FNR family cyclic AMP-dependent transcriptional regulator
MEEDWMTTADVLRGVPLFSGLTDRAVEAIAGLTTETTFADGESLVREGDPGETFIVLLGGAAEVVRDHQPVAELARGDFLGEISLIDGGPRTATVIARGPVSALVVQHTDFRRLFEEFGAIRYDIVTALTRRIRRDAADPTL